VPYGAGGSAPRAKKCSVCTGYLRLDGTCKWGCDPKLKAPGKRAVEVERAAKKREEKAKKYDLPGANSREWGGRRVERKRRRRG
jgi:hypothetical protein